MDKLLSAEWLRIRHYWLTWVLAGAWILLLALQVNAKIDRLSGHGVSGVARAAWMV